MSEITGCSPRRHCSARHHKDRVTEAGGFGGDEMVARVLDTWQGSVDAGLHEQQVVCHELLKVVLLHIHVHGSDQVSAGAVAAHQDPERHPVRK